MSCRKLGICATHNSSLRVAACGTPALQQSWIFLDTGRRNNASVLHECSCASADENVGWNSSYRRHTQTPFLFSWLLVRFDTQGFAPFQHLQKHKSNDMVTKCKYNCWKRLAEKKFWVLPGTMFGGGFWMKPTITTSTLHQRNSCYFCCCDFILIFLQFPKQLQGEDQSTVLKQDRISAQDVFPPGRSIFKVFYHSLQFALQLRHAGSETLVLALQSCRHLAENGVDLSSCLTCQQIHNICLWEL